MKFPKTFSSISAVERNRLKAFTLVEMLVVIAIIGILAAILVPVIGGALRRSSEFAITGDMQNIETALENYKSETFVYPTDFIDPATFAPQVAKLSGQARTANLAAFLDVSTVLVNPHFALGTSTIEERSPSTIDAAEAWVFWLYETTNDPLYPLGAEWNEITSAWETPSATKHRKVWNPNRFMEFDTTRLTDVDGDGWFEYVAPSGKQDVPYVYFDSRTYETDASIALYVTGDHGITGAGTAMPYAADEDSVTHVVTWFQKKYQLINCGLDNNFGAAADHKVLENKENIATADRDNICIFSKGRLDSSFDD